MITIYQIGRSGIWTGATAEIEENDGAPPGWTRTAPPALGAGQYALWSGGWQVVDELPQPASDTVDPTFVNRERDRRIAAGTTVTVTGYGDIPLQGGERDQTNLLGLVAAAQVRLAGGDSTTLTRFRDAQNVDHMLTPTQIIEMWSKGAAWISANYEASWAIKALDPIPADYADDERWP